MATDYDAPCRGEVDELSEDSLEELKARRAEAQSGSIDVDETELNESLELPGADLSKRSKRLPSGSLSPYHVRERRIPHLSQRIRCMQIFARFLHQMLSFEILHERIQRLSWDL